MPSSKFTFLIYLIFLPFLSFSQSTASTKLTDFQRSMGVWDKNGDFDPEEKGWKWLKRWEEHWSTRAMPDGSLPDPAVIASEVRKVARWKTQSSSSSRTSGWMPAGPSELPPGANPSSQHGMGRINCITFHPTDSNTFWVGVAQGGVWKTTDHGNSWTPLTDDLPILRISDIAVNPQNTDEIYLSVGDYAYLAVALELDDRKRHTHYGIGVYKTTDGGQSWNPTGLTLDQTNRDASLTRRVLIHPSNPSELIASGIYGIKKSYDGGDNWTTVSDSIIWDIEPVPGRPDVLYASTGFIRNLQTGTAGIWKSTDFGETWTELTTGIPRKDTVQRIEIAISPVDPDYVYAVTCNLSRGFYAFYRSTDGGNSWTEQANATNTHNLLYWYIHFNGNGGQGTYDLAILADPNDRDKVYVGGVNIWGTKDGGANWEPATLWYSGYGKSLHADQHYFAHNPLDNQYYICNDGGVMRTQAIISCPVDSVVNTPGFVWPTQWEDLNDGMQITSFYRLGLSRSAPGFRMGGSQDNSTFISNGTSWINSFGGDGMECLIYPDNPAQMIGSSQFGRLVISQDGGYSYNNISNFITQNTDELASWTTPFMLQPDDPSILYAAYSNLWKSTTNGSFWSQISNFPPMNGTTVSAPASALAIAPSDPQTIYVAHRIYHSYDQPSRLWRTTDGGSNWTEITLGLPDSMYFSYLAVDHTNPQRLWVSISGFLDGSKVYESMDGGNSWTNISYNLPNLPANCVIAQDSSESHLIYVGMDRGVYYLSDSLSEWQLFADNLPNVIVSEMELHPETNQLYIATFGRGMWVSDQVEEMVDPPLSNDLIQDDRWKIELFPNPNSGSFSLQIEGLQQTPVEITIVDVMGRRVYQEGFNNFGSEFRKNLLVREAAGLYFVKISQRNRSKVLRLVLN